MVDWSQPPRYLFIMFTAVRYCCSALGCLTSTSGHYCLTHGAFCTDCGREFNREELARGLCIDCEPIDEPEYACAADAEMAMAWGFGK